MNGVKETDENAVLKLQNLNNKKDLHGGTINNNKNNSKNNNNNNNNVNNHNKLSKTISSSSSTSSTSSSTSSINYQQLSSTSDEICNTTNKNIIDQIQLKENLGNTKDEKISGNGREARNRAEKNRRDKLNGSITELSAMVPHVAESQRRVDKTAVLRFSAHGLRINYIFGKSDDHHGHVKIQPKCTETFLKLMESFLITITCRGQIVLVSPSIEQHLGHCQTDLFGQNILNIIHPDDHANVKRQMVPTNIESLFDLQSDEESGETKPRTQEEEENIDKILREDKRNFTVRFARAGPRSEPTSYEIVRINGCFRRADYAPRGVKSTSLPSGLQLIRRSRGRDDGIPLHTISGNDIVLVAMGCVIKPPSVCERLREACKYEYRTRHLIDGRIVQCDQRISVVAGYMTDEVSGLSPFTFMHKDDVRWVIVALRQMYDYSKPYGESCYRLMTRTGQFIYLRTRGYLEVDSNTNEVHTFCCINTLVDEEEGKQMCHEMKKKFSVIINPNELIPLESDVSSVENPQQIERAVLNLITNLPSSAHNKIEEDDCDDEHQQHHHHHHHRHHNNQHINSLTEITGNDDDDGYDEGDDDINDNNHNDYNQDNNVNIKNENYLNDKKCSLNSSSSSCSDQQEQEQIDIQRKVKSPPLAIIAPKPCTIKSSITKSLNVIVAATKGTESSSSSSTFNSNNKLHNNNDKNINLQQQQQRPSVLHKVMANINNINNDNLDKKQQIKQQIADDNKLLFATIKTETEIIKNLNNDDVVDSDSGGGDGGGGGSGVDVYCNQQQYDNKINLSTRKNLPQQLLPDYSQKKFIPLHQALNTDNTTIVYNNTININQNLLTNTHLINNSNNNSSNNSNRRTNSNLKRNNLIDDFKDPTKRRLIVNNEQQQVNLFTTPRNEFGDYDDADLTQTLPPFSVEAQVNKSLNHLIEGGATQAEHRNPYNTYSVLQNTRQQQLNDIIIEEHQEQHEILKSIQQNEYHHTQIQNTSHHSQSPSSLSSTSSSSSSYDTVTNKITEQDTVTR